MKNLRSSDFARFMAITLATIVSLGTFIAPRPAHAQSFEQILAALNSQPVSAVSTGDDTDVAMLIRYVGTGANNSGTVEVTVTSSDLTFLQGVQGSEAASTELECPVSGALGGIIDASNAACNTLGEIVDIINDSTSWRAVILDGTRADVWDARGVTMAATRATTLDGLAIKWDTSTAFDYQMALVPPEYRKMSAYLRGGNLDLQPDIYDNSQTTFMLGNATSTYASGTSNLVIYSIDVGKLDSGNSYTETATTLYSEPGGATATNKIFDDQAGFSGIRSRPNEKMLIRLDNSAAMSSVTFRAYGNFKRQ